MSDWIEHSGKKYFEESYLEQANETARRARQERDEALATVARLREALSNPAMIFETEYAENFAREVLAETPAESLEAIRAEAKREERAAIVEEIERIEVPPNLEGPAVGAWISARNYAAHIVRTFGLKEPKWDHVDTLK